jgi:hypothetical protein
VAGAALAAGCQPTAPPALSAEEAQAAGALLVQGSASEALTILESRDLTSDPSHAALLVEALIHDNQADAALAALEQVDDELRHQALLIDLCVRGVEHASPDAGQMQGSLDHCEGIERVDLMAASALISIVSLPVLDEIAEGYPDRGMEAMTSPLDAMILYNLSRRIDESAPGRARDGARRLLEASYVAASTRVPDPVARMLARRDAYLVANSPELGEGLVDEIVSRADALAVTDPQGAATLYEIVIFGNVGELEIPPEMHERATAQTRAVLFPVFLENFTERYERKHLEVDIEAGIVTQDDRNARFAPAATMDEREHALAAWLYRVSERPQPIMPPAFAPRFEGCADPATQCVVSYEDMVRTVYNIDAVEQAHALATGVAVAYPSDAAPE